MTDIGEVQRFVIYHEADRVPDQLDVQIEMAVRVIRRETNDARRRLGLRQREYGMFTPMEELARKHNHQQL